MNLVSIGIGDSTTHSRQRQWWRCWRRRRRRHVIQVRARLRHVEPPPLVVKITPGVHVARSEALRGDERARGDALRDARCDVVLVARGLARSASLQLVRAVADATVRGRRGRVARLAVLVQQLVLYRGHLVLMQHLEVVSKLSHVTLQPPPFTSPRTLGLSPDDEGCGIVHASPGPCDGLHGEEVRVG